MDFLYKEIGSAKDNLNSPIHNWFKFTAGFSYKFIEEIIKCEDLNSDSIIFDPFAGCGTTLVSAQKNNIKAIGNEAQSFMYDIIKAKLGWNIDEIIINQYLDFIKAKVKENELIPLENRYINPLLFTLYENSDLLQLVSIKESIEAIKTEKYLLFFKLALSQTLHKVSLYPIAAPYISRNKKRNSEKIPVDEFSNICEKMSKDIKQLSSKRVISKVYKHDSRKKNNYIADNSSTICISSPPYLNNLDYGEVSKVHTHFFGITNDWNDITKNVRKKLVTGSTTHYTPTDFVLEDYLTSDFAIQNKNVIKKLVKSSKLIKSSAAEKNGKKSFDILVLLYFQDMFSVLCEIKRVLKSDGKAYLIIGDSAPYGVHIPTTKFLGLISNNIGFNNYKIIKIRDRGTKWKTLRFRHSETLAENLLILS